MSNHQTLADLLGPWAEPHFDSGLIERCKRAWTKPLKELTNQELATLLLQKIALAHLLPLARQRIVDGIEDDTEWYEGELVVAIEQAGQIA